MLLSKSFLKETFFVLATTVILFFLSITLHKEIYFRDYSIIWEGAYRLYLNQTPFIDFGLPLGPVCLWLPALMMKFFGPSNETLRWSGLIIMFSSSVIFWILINQIGKLKFWIKYLSVLLFMLHYSLGIQFPWYNTTAFLLLLLSLLFLLLSFKVANHRRYFLLFMSGMASSLTFFAKQDFGLLAVTSHFSLIFIFSFYIPSHQNKNITSLKSFLYTLSCWLLGNLVIAAFIIPWPHFSNFMYWFNVGQPPHSNRVHNLTGNWLHYQKGEVGFIKFLVFASIVGLMYSWRNRNYDQLKTYLFSTTILGVSFITYQTSGLYWLTSTFYASIIPIMLQSTPHLFLKQFTFLKSKRALYSLTLIVIGILTTVTIPKINFVRLLTIWSRGGIADFFLNQPNSSENWQSLEQTPDLRAVFGTSYLRTETIQGLYKLKAIDRLNLKKFDCPLLNMTEFTPIFFMLQLEPCKNELPLWYNTGISLFPREINKIKVMITQKKIGLLLVQNTHEGPGFYPEFIQWIETQSYSLVFSFPAANTSAPVHVFMPNTLSISDN